MPLFRRSVADVFVRFDPVPFQDLEHHLETWIAANPTILSDTGDLAIFSRQPHTAHGKFADLLGIDQAGACVVVELKRGETPREVVAQTLEYAAWVDSLSFDDLDQLARDYDSKYGAETGGLVELYCRTFTTDGSSDDGSVSVTDRIAFNHRKRMVIVAEEFRPEVEETLRYLRTKHGIDISGIRFGIHRAGEELILETEMIVGRERMVAEVKKPASVREPESDESILNRVGTDFMRYAVSGIENWVRGLEHGDVEVRHGSASDHFVHIRGQRQLHYYFARQWVTCSLVRSSPHEMDMLRGKLSKTNEVVLHPSGNYVRFHLASDDDLSVLQAVIGARVPQAPDASFAE